MSIIKNANKNLFAIQTKLESNEDIRKLLYNNVSSALVETAPTKDKVSNLITVKPIVDYNTEENNTNIFNFIVIYMTTAVSQESQTVFTYNVDIYTHNDYYFLDNKKTRLLEISDRVIDLLDDIKLYSAGKLVFDGMVIKTIAGSRLMGYSLTFNTIDGNTTKF